MRLAGKGTTFASVLGGERREGSSLSVSSRLCFFSPRWPVDLFLFSSLYSIHELDDPVVPLVSVREREQPHRRLPGQTTTISTSPIVATTTRRALNNRRRAARNSPSAIGSTAVWGRAKRVERQERGERTGGGGKLRRTVGEPRMPAPARVTSRRRTRVNAPVVRQRGGLLFLPAK